MGQDNEASVEEILESIKKVIARDNREDALKLRRRREGDGIVRTTQPGFANPAEQRAPAADTGDAGSGILDLGEMEFAEDIDDYADAGDPVHGGGEDQTDHGEDGDSPLTSAAMAQSMRDNFAALAMLAEPGAPPQIVRSGETSLEGLVRDMLRPMLAEWLDKNLPGMVEKMVQAEIARIAGKRG